VTLTILEGSTFCICDDRGDVGDETSGFFAYDTRFLSRFRLTINGERRRRQTRNGAFYFNVLTTVIRVLATRRERADGALGGVVVDGDAGVVEEKGEAVPAAKGVAHGLGKLALAGDAGELLLAPGSERQNARTALLLTHGQAALERLAVNRPFDVVELADLLQGASGDG
jgi:hypothetical protein